jgi:hypothetical protein
MMSDHAAKYHALFQVNANLATLMEEKFSAWRGWNCVLRFYAALHLMNAYLIDKRTSRSIRSQPSIKSGRARWLNARNCATPRKNTVG